TAIADCGGGNFIGSVETDHGLNLKSPKVVSTVNCPSNELPDHFLSASLRTTDDQLLSSTDHGKSCFSIRKDLPHDNVRSTD
ncbi:hypothetical protein NPIL_616011, partial [Nephila pilipes]